MTREARNLVASVRSRLRHAAHERGEEFDLVLQRYAVERLLVRLARSPYRGRFILKGAMLYVAWGEGASRPTRDLDLLGQGPAELEWVTACFRALCAVEVVEDGLSFLAANVRAEEIRDQTEYGGIRVRFEARLGNVRIPLQVDVGFGDVLVPGSQEVDFPTLLGGPAPRIRAYPRESVIAEKLHAAVLLGDTNTRMKDFYDLFALSRLFAFEGPVLTKGIAATFEQRGMPLAAPPPFAPAFFDQDARASQWRSFLKRSRLDLAPQDFTAVGEALRGFVAPPYGALAAGLEYLASWPPGGPWR
jgi:predicted nucleotidyltransferase component of viral defense system